MAYKNKGHAWHVQNEVVRVSGRFRPNGSSAVDNTLNQGVGYTVARVSTGLFRITFTDVGKQLVAFGGGLMLATGGDQKLEFGAYSQTNKTLDLRVWDISAAAVADLASDADTWISFWVEFQDTKTKKRAA